MEHQSETKTISSPRKLANNFQNNKLQSKIKFFDKRKPFLRPMREDETKKPNATEMPKTKLWCPQ